jgi:hypothetical protein
MFIQKADFKGKIVRSECMWKSNKQSQDSQD